MEKNPHQIGVYFGDLDKIFDQLCGKEIFLQQFTDINAAV